MGRPTENFPARRSAGFFPFASAVAVHALTFPGHRLCCSAGTGACCQTGIRRDGHVQIFRQSGARGGRVRMRYRSAIWLQRSGVWAALLCTRSQFRRGCRGRQRRSGRWPGRGLLEPAYRLAVHPADRIALRPAARTTTGRSTHSRDRLP